MKFRHGCCLVLLAVTSWLPNAYALNGPYVGLMGGYASVEPSPNLDLQLVDLPFHQTTHLDFGASDWLWGPFLGYAMLRDRLFLATEVQASWSQIDAHASDQHNLKTDFTLQEQYSWQIRPGMQVYPDFPLFLYAILGVTWAEFDLQYDAVPSLSFNEFVRGYQLGTGLNYQFTEHVFARFDYVFNQFDDFAKDGTLLVERMFLADAKLKTTSQSSQYLLAIGLIW